jgi:hypothetical protein
MQYQRPELSLAVPARRAHQAAGPPPAEQGERAQPPAPPPSIDVDDLAERVYRLLLRDVERTLHIL